MGEMVAVPGGCASQSGERRPDETVRHDPYPYLSLLYTSVKYAVTDLTSPSLTSLLPPPPPPPLFLPRTHPNSLLTWSSTRLSPPQIRTHPFFADVDFATLRQLPAPRPPVLSSSTDTSYFPTEELKDVGLDRVEPPAVGEGGGGGEAERDLAFLGYVSFLCGEGEWMWRWMWVWMWMWSLMVWFVRVGSLSSGLRAYRRFYRIWPP